MNSAVGTDVTLSMHAIVTKAFRPRFPVDSNLGHTSLPILLRRSDWHSSQNLSPSEIRTKSSHSMSQSYRITGIAFLGRATFEKMTKNHDPFSQLQETIERRYRQLEKSRLSSVMCMRNERRRRRHVTRVSRRIMRVEVSIFMLDCVSFFASFRRPPSCNRPDVIILCTGSTH